MGSEIVLIFAFQIFLGYIYAKIGMIVTAMLAGLLPGAWLGYRYARDPRRMLRLADLLIVVWLVLSMILLFAGGDRLPPGFYYTAGFCIAMLCGFQLPLALAAIGDDNRGVARLFAVDLIGAAFGALLTSTILIPYLGLGGAIVALVVAKMSSLLLIGGSYVRSGPTRLHRR
jgi:predicted membrane-bound spermidine synthase